MGTKIILVASALLVSSFVNAETVIPSDYIIAGEVGDAWVYERLDSTQFTWTLSQVVSGPNAGRFERGNIDSGMVYDLAGNVLTIYEGDKDPLIPPWDIGEIGLGQLATVGDPLDPELYLFWTVPSITVQVGTFNNVLAWVFLDDASGPNIVNAQLGLPLSITAAVSGVIYYVPGFGEVKAQGVFHETGEIDGGHELVSTTVKTPTCDIQLNQLTYFDGETITADVYRYANLTSSPITLEAKVWWGLPAGEPPMSVTNLGSDGSVVLPPGTDVDTGPVPLELVTAAMPRGSYEFSCRMLDPVTGELLAEDRNFFDIIFGQKISLINGSWQSICESFEEEPTFVAYEWNIRTFNDGDEHIVSEVFDTPDCSGVPRYNFEADRSYVIGDSLTADTGELVYEIDFMLTTGEIELDIVYIGTDTLNFGDGAPAGVYSTDLDFEYVYTKLP